MHERHVQAADLDHVLAYAEDDLLELAGARVLLTGGTGYVGRWLLEALSHANRRMRLGLRVTVLSRNPDHFRLTHPHLGNDGAVSFVTGDVRGFSVPGEGFSHAIHAATDVVAETAPLEMFDVNVLGTRRVLEWCREQRVERVLLLSSGAVYGRIPAAIQHVPEDWACALRTDESEAAYGIGKMATEWLGAAYSAAGLPKCSSARVFAQVGPYLALDKQFAAGNFIGNALRGEPFVITGDGTPRRSYMYGTDLAIWLLAILRRGAAGRAYNVGSDQAISIVGLAEAVARAAGIENPDIQIRGVPEPGASPAYYVPDITRARNELGLDITIQFQEALWRTFAWYQRFSAANDR